MTATCGWALRPLGTILMTSSQPQPLPQTFPALPHVFLCFYLEIPGHSTWQMVQEERVIFPASCSSSLSPILMCFLLALPPHLSEPEENCAPSMPLLPSSVPMSIQLCIQQMLVECLLCKWHCSRTWDRRADGQNKTREKHSCPYGACI